MIVSTPARITCIGISIILANKIFRPSCCPILVPTMNEIADYLDAEFIKKCGDGDIIVAGNDFGCGSSREHAVWALQGANVGAIIAQTFARIFYRNCINCGFYVVELPDAPEKINDGDDIDIDYKAGVINNKTQGTEIKFNPLPDFAVEIIEDGGLLKHISKK